MQLLHRFVVIGDYHRGNVSTSSSHFVGVDDRTGPRIDTYNQSQQDELLLDKIQKVKEEPGGIDFIHFTGDVVNGNVGVQPNIDFKNQILDVIGLPYSISYGNHDHLTDQQWFDVYGQHRDHAFTVGDYGFIILNSSDESGARQVCRSEPFLKEKLQEYKNKKGVFFLSHVPRFAGGFRGDPITSPDNFGADSPECTEILDMLTNCDNLVCTIHGHFHEFNNILSYKGIPVIFGNHWASYGVNYRGVRIFEIYDDGSIYTRLDGFTATKVSGEWVYDYRERSYQNLRTKFIKPDSKKEVVQSKRGLFPPMRP